MKKRITMVVVFVVIMCTVTSTAFAYSPTNAITYSNSYALNPNQLNSSGEGYSVYTNDCTNFVSQCLFAGGLAKDSTWYSYVEWSSNAPHRNDSVAWIRADSLKNYLKNNLGASKIGSWSRDGSSAPYQTYAYKQNGVYVKNSNNLTNSNKGKTVLFYDWNADGTMNHAALFVKNNATSTYSGEGTGDLINQHSENRKQVLWIPDIRDNTYSDTLRIYAFQL